MMDVTLNKIPMEGYTCLLDTVIYQEETQESIVPDACPDILTVISTEGHAQLSHKTVQEGKAEITGTARLCVLYTPDGAEGVRSLPLNIPFRCTAAVGGMSGEAVLTALPKVIGAETRALNPRKVLARVELAVVVQCWGTLDEALYMPADGGEVPLCQRTEETERYMTAGVAEKTFTLTEEVTLSASHPRAEAILGHRLELRCGDAKIIGTKLVFKGEAALEAVYRGEDGGLAVGHWELPFSQIMEVEGVSEEGTCALELVERESEVSLSGDEEGRVFTVHLGLTAQAVIRETRPVTLFTDAYSVTHGVDVERGGYVLDEFFEEETTQQVVREVLQTQGMARSVEDQFVTLGEPQMEKDGQEWVLSVHGKVTVLYIGEDECLAAASAPITAQCRIAMPENGKCGARCHLCGEVQAVAASGGIEVRVPVQFSYLTTVEKTREAVVGLTAQEREDPEELPSVILRLAQPGECLWDIAKAYFTTEEDILAANDLPDPADMGGCLLLIPRSR